MLAVLKAGEHGEIFDGERVKSYLSELKLAPSGYGGFISKAIKAGYVDESTNPHDGHRNLKVTPRGLSVLPGLQARIDLIGKSTTG